MTDATIQIDSELKEELPEIVLFVSNAANYTEVSISIIENLVKRREMPCVYITLNRPFETMKQILEKFVDLELLIFIDGITRAAAPQPKQTHECLYLTNMNSLTDLAIAIDQAMDALAGDKKFLLMDSLSTLLIYNQAGSVSRFIHWLTGKLRGSKVKGMFLLVERESDRDFIAQLSLFCDKTINI